MREIAEHVKSQLGFDYVILGLSIVLPSAGQVECDVCRCRQDLPRCGD